MFVLVAHPAAVTVLEPVSVPVLALALLLAYLALLGKGLVPVAVEYKSAAAKCRGLHLLVVRPSPIHCPIPTRPRGLRLS